MKKENMEIVQKIGSMENLREVLILGLAMYGRVREQKEKVNKKGEEIKYDMYSVQTDYGYKADGYKTDFRFYHVRPDVTEDIKGKNIVSDPLSRLGIEIGGKK